MYMLFTLLEVDFPKNGWVFFYYNNNSNNNKLIQIKKKKKFIKNSKTNKIPHSKWMYFVVRHIKKICCFFPFFYLIRIFVVQQQFIALLNSNLSLTDEYKHTTRLVAVCCVLWVCLYVFCCLTFKFINKQQILTFLPTQLHQPANKQINKQTNE